MEELLIGYALKALPPDEMAEAERLLAADPAAAANLAKLRGFLTVLSADAERDVPSGLAVGALAAVAAHIVDNKLPLEAHCSVEPARCASGSDFHPVLGECGPIDASFEELPPVPASLASSVRGAYPVRRWFEIGIVAAIAFVSLGLVVTGMMKIRHESQVAACKQNMLNLYRGLSGYADTHYDQFPKVGTPAAPNAGAFVSELKVACQLLPDTTVICPAESPVDCDLTRVAYAYTLGYREPGGELRGLDRLEAKGWSNAQTPLLADLPTPGASPADGPTSPHGKGQNILFADGHVRYSCFATVNDDDIYRNQVGRVRAGLHRLDASLGRATDVP